MQPYIGNLQARRVVVTGHRAAQVTARIGVQRLGQADQTRQQRLGNGQRHTAPKGSGFREVCGGRWDALSGVAGTAYWRAAAGADSDTQSLRRGAMPLHEQPRSFQRAANSTLQPDL